jgi:DNA-binding NarL/FixJ family response regulator
MLLKLESDMDVVGMAEDGAMVVEMIAGCQPDLVLMDLKMPIMNGVEATRRIRARYPQVKVLILTTYDDDEWISDAVQAGASGYLLKDTPRSELVKAIRGTVEGKTFLDPSVAGKVLRQASSHMVQPSPAITGKLTDREVEVLKLIAGGLNNRDIADRLYLSEGTVRNHVSAILAKLGVSDRTQAAVIAMQHGLQ